MNRDSAYDVIVVGAGPAGATAACRAARDGASVLLLDEARFPRPKACGGAVSEGGLKQLSFAVAPELIHGPIHGVRLFYRGAMVEVRRPGRLGIQVSRADFDHYLVRQAEAAGACFMDGTRVDEVSEDRDLVSVHTPGTEYRARAVIAADGSLGSVARRVRAPLARRHQAAAYECEVPVERHPTGDLIDIHFGGLHRGYSWVFPKRGFLNVGAAALATRAQALRRTVSALVEGLDGGAGGKPTGGGMGWVVPAGGYARRTGRGRILVAGDAAGFCDSFTGEGIAHAISSGGEAGRLLARAACAGGARRAIARARREYAWFCGRTITRHLFFALLIAKLLHAWPDLLLRRFTSERELVARFLDVQAGELSYSRYCAWLLPRLVAWPAPARTR